MSKQYQKNVPDAIGVDAALERVGVTLGQIALEAGEGLLALAGSCRVTGVGGDDGR